jgi:hypothetical protein
MIIIYCENKKGMVSRKEDGRSDYYFYYWYYYAVVPIIRITYFF